MSRSKIPRGKTKAKGKGGVLERARNKLGLTRRQVVEMFNKQSTTPLHEITLYKYEKGALQLPRSFAPMLGGILQIEPGGLFADDNRSVKQLRYACLPHTDSEILEFALTIGRLDDVNRYLPKVKFEGEPLKSSKEILEHLVAGNIDIALFNTNEFEMQNGEVANSVQKLGQVVRFHSYAILFAPPEKGEWLSFQELFNRQVPRMSRAARLESALTCMLAQLWPAAGSPAPKVLFAPGSDRHTLLVQLLKLARDRATEDSEPRLLALQGAVEQANSHGAAEVDCFKEFLDCLADSKKQCGGAIFVGTIPQRLIAETRGAGLLMSPENFAWLAAGRDSFDRVFQPTNSLLVNRQTYNSQPEQLDAAIVRWNAAVQHIQSPQGANLVPIITGSIRQEMARYFGSQTDPSPEDVAKRIFAERLIVLMPHSAIGAGG